MRFIDLSGLAFSSSESRMAAARAVIKLLNASERIEFTAELIKAIEDARPFVTPESTRSPTTTSTDRPLSKTDRAAAYICAHPGCTTKEIAEFIGQTPKVAGTTLRQLEKSRHSIQRREGKWYPLNAP